MDEKDVLTIDDHIKKTKESLESKLEIIKGTIVNSLDAALGKDAEDLDISDLAFIAKSLNNLSSSTESDINHLCNLIERREKFVDDQEENPSKKSNNSPDKANEDGEEDRDDLKTYMFEKVKEVSIERELSKSKRKDLMKSVSDCNSRQEVDEKIEEFESQSSVKQDFEDEFGNW